MTVSAPRGLRGSRVRYAAAMAMLAGGLLAASCSRLGPRSQETTPPPPPLSITHAELLDSMHADGSISRFILTRKRAGRDATPKYPGKAWEWFVERRIPVESTETALPLMYREEALEFTRRNNMDKSTLKVPTAQWSYLGPGGNVMPSGRIVEIAVHPQDPNTVYAGGASGGLFKTTDQGMSWTNVTDGFLPSLGVGSVEIDPHNPSHVYIGMGEGVPASHYEPTGNGIYRSTDNGVTWALVNGTEGMEHVTEIAFGANSDTILAAASGRRDRRGAGLFRTSNGGQSWQTISSIPFYDISMDRANPQNVVATSGLHSTDQGTQAGGIFYSTDGGVNFTLATTPPLVNQQQGTGAYRIELARNGNTLYALVGANDASIFGIWKSTDGGQNWTELPQTGIPQDGDYKPGQMQYNNSIAVSPTNANRVWIGSNLRMYLSTDGGQNWTAKADWAGEGGLPYVHADHHHIRHGATDQVVYFATDGGFFVSTDGGNTWQERNVGLNITQIYRISNHPTNRTVVAMGTQDNDKYIRRADESWHHYPNTFGDCMEIHCWPNDPSVYLGTGYYGANMRVTLNGGDDGWFFLRGYGGSNNGIPDNERGAWVIPFFLDPQDPTVMYAGLTHIYRATFSTEFAPQWQRIIELNPDLTPHSMELMRLTAGPTNRKLFGFLGRRSEQGLSVALFRANPDGQNFELVDLPRIGYVNAIATDPNNNETIWLGYSDIASPIGPKPRLFRSTNLGDTWQDMTNNFPQSLPVSAIFIDPQNSQTIIVGSDIGVYRSDDAGATWSFWNEGLPKVVVVDFDYYAPDRLLRAGTYGRGMYETPIDGVPGAPDIRIEPETLMFP